MARDKTIRVQTPADTTQVPKVSLIQKDFNAKIEQFGYEVFWEEAHKCPCTSRVEGYHASSKCKNCGGTGWIFVNRTKTRMLLTAINLDTSQKEWSEIKAGTVKVTAKTTDRISYMDRITIQSGESLRTELLTIHRLEVDIEGQTKVRYAGFTVYDVSEVMVAFMCVDDQQPLVKLTPIDDYSVSYNRFILTPEALTRLGITEQEVENYALSIKYLHKPQFHIIDMVRDIITSPTLDFKSKKQEETVFPLHAIARRSHYVLDEENYKGSRILNNDFDNCN